MSLTRFFTILLSVLVLFSSSLMAEEKAGKEMTLKGKAYINWHTNMTDSTDEEGGEQENTFQIERVYLTWLSKFSNGWSARVTTDVENKPVYEDAEVEVVDENEDGIVQPDEIDVTLKSKTKYTLYIKYAYVEKKADLGPASLKFRFGMIGTPMIGFTDKLADQRWAHKNMIDDSKYILIRSNGKGYGIDNSADMGASLSVKLMKMVEIVFAVTNGEGYKASLESEDDETDEGKAYYGRITINPIKPLFISGYYRREGMNTDEADDHEGYYGGGVAWKDSKMIMIGVNYIAAFKKEEGEDYEGTQVDGTDEKYEFSVIDAWITLKFDSIIGMPLFVMARYGIGDTGHKEGKTTFIGTGIGYKFDKNVRFIAWYQQYDNELADYGDEPNPGKKFYVKTEVKI